MRSTGNPDLDAVLRMREADAAKRAKRYAVVRWMPQVTYYEMKEQARDVLARTPLSRRAGLVDCETGDTWVNKKSYPAVMAAVRRQETKPNHFHRVGRLGPIQPKRRRPKGPGRRL